MGKLTGSTLSALTSNPLSEVDSFTFPPSQPLGLRQLTNILAGLKEMNENGTDTSVTRQALTLPLRNTTLSLGPSTFKLDELLGAGTSGIVFKAHDTSSLFPVAVKFTGPFPLGKQDSFLLLPRRSQVDPGRKVQSEGIALARLKEKKLSGVPVLENLAIARLSDTEAAGILVMNFAPGRNLNEILRGCTSSEHIAPILCRAYARVLNNLPKIVRAGVLPTDFEGDNIQVEISNGETQEGKVKAVTLLDYGDALIVPEDGFARTALKASMSYLFRAIHDLAEKLTELHGIPSPALVDDLKNLAVAAEESSLDFHEAYRTLMDLAELYST